MKNMLKKIMSLLLTAAVISSSVQLPVLADMIPQNEEKEVVIEEAENDDISVLDKNNLMEEESEIVDSVRGSQICAVLTIDGNVHNITDASSAASDINTLVENAVSKKSTGKLDSVSLIVKSNITISEAIIFDNIKKLDIDLGGYTLKGELGETSYSDIGKIIYICEEVDDTNIANGTLLNTYKKEREYQAYTSYGLYHEGLRIKATNLTAIAEHCGLYIGSYCIEEDEFGDEYLGELRTESAIIAGGNYGSEESSFGISVDAKRIEARNANAQAKAWAGSYVGENVILNGGTYTGGAGIGVSTLKNGNAIVDNVTAKGEAGLDWLGDSGSLTINGGTFQSDSSDSWDAALSVSGDGGTVYVNGGSFIASNGAHGLLATESYGNDKVSNIVLSGGRFSSIAKGGYPEGYFFVYNEGVQSFLKRGCFYYNKEGKKVTSDNGPIYDEVVVSEEVEDIRKANSNNFYWADNNGKHIGITLNETLLAGSTSEYNHDLARFAIEMSTLCYSEDFTNNKTDEVYTALNKLGFNEIEHHTYTECRKKHIDICYDEGKKELGAFSPYWIASKKINLNGEATTIVGVFIRGTFCEEWIDNFNPGRENTHEGFDRSAEKIVFGIADYYRKYVEGSSKIFVTGHSRGAAAANLVGKKIDDGKVLGINSSNSFIYTFATPNTAKIKGTDKDKYKNIYNIVNPEDFVTKVLPSKWGYGRYGKTYVLPSSTTDRTVNGKSFSDYLTDINSYLRWMGYDKNYYLPYRNGMYEVSNYVSYICSRIKNIDKYYDEKIFADMTLYDLYTHVLGYSQCKVKKKEALAYAAMGLAIAGRYGDVGTETMVFFTVHQALREEFGKAHASEDYLAAMCVISETELMRERDILFGIINCPVDVYIYDKNGLLLGKIVNNDVQDIDSQIVMSVEEDSKRFCVPTNEEYQIQLVGNDFGSMDYSLIELDPDVGELSRVYYHDVEVDKTMGSGSKYTQNITANGELKSFILYNADNSVVEPTAFISGDELGNLYVNTTVEGAEGYADSFSSLTPGDYVSLKAYETENSSFVGWYDKDGNLVSSDNPYCFSISKSMDLIAKFKNGSKGLDVKQLEETGYTYTGKAIKPEIQVYDGNALLTKGVDYTVSYKDNVNSYELSEKDQDFRENDSPKIIIKGKGNYKDTEYVTFKINPVSISGNDISVLDIPVMMQGAKNAAPVPKLKFNNKALKAGKDFKYEYYSSPECKDSVISFHEGTYYIKISGINNFTGDIVEEMYVGDPSSQKDVSKLKIDKIPARKYTGNPITVSGNDLAVYDGQTKLVQNKNYSVSFKNNNEAGTATLRIKGIDGKYIGTKSVTFKIEGIPVNKLNMSGMESSVMYDGKPQMQSGITFTEPQTSKTVKAIDKQSYDKLSDADKKNYGVVIEFTNNVSAGKATMVIVGVNGYTGTQKKTFKIMPYDVVTNPNAQFKVKLDETDYLYSKAGVTPEPVVTFGEETLIRGRDYNVSYLNNKIISDGTGVNPTVKVTGKGNFKGVDTSLTFKIKAKDLSISGNGIRLASDVVYFEKPGNWKTKIDIYDNGVKLNAGKDYSNDIEYTYVFIPADAKIHDGTASVDRKVGDAVGEKDIVPKGTVIGVKVQASANPLCNYTGTLNGTYRIVDYDISKFKTYVKPKEYTGREIKLSKEDISFKLGKDELSGVEFEIDESSYKNNIMRGTASVVIYGLDDCGRGKLVTYKVGPRKLVWWWR